jgi:hypothetical protein
LSINQIAFLLSPSYKTLYDRIKDTETTFVQGFPTVWDRISQTVGGPTQVDETQQVCSDFKGQDPPREGLDRGGSPEGGRTHWTGDQGDEMTLIAACRDVLRVVSAEEGTDYDEEYVSGDGVHTNQAECLWSLLQPWLAKFRGLSKQGLEQAARTYGFLRSLNLTRAPIHGLVDCIAVNVFR